MQIFSHLIDDSDKNEDDESRFRLPIILADPHPVCEKCTNTATRRLANGLIGCVENNEPCAWNAASIKKP